MTSVAKSGGLAAENIASEARARSRARKAAAIENARENRDVRESAGESRRSAKAAGVGRKVDVSA